MPLSLESYSYSIKTVHASLVNVCMGVANIFLDGGRNLNTEGVTASAEGGSIFNCPKSSQAHFVHFVRKE